MNKVSFVVLASLFIYSLVFPQAPTNPVNNLFNKKKCPEGSCTLNYLSGKKRQVFHLVNGNFEGEVVEYFKNGKVRVWFNFENGFFDGCNKIFNSKGQLIVEEKYSHDTILYYREIKYYNNGQIKSDIYLTFGPDSLFINPFIDSKKVGLQRRITYDVNKSFYHMKSNGFNKGYFKNGSIKHEIPLINNMFEGVGKSFYKDGSVYRYCPFRNNLIDGEFIYYKNDGSILKKELWSKGKKIKRIE